MEETVGPLEGISAEEVMQKISDSLEVLDRKNAGLRAAKGSASLL